MTDVNSVIISFVIIFIFIFYSGFVFFDFTEYMIIVGSFQYLLFIRSDIVFVVNNFFQFMYFFTVDYWNVVKYFLRYFCGTADYGIIFYRSFLLSLYVFSDADWAGNNDDFIFISVYIVYFGCNFIFWSSKKQSTVARLFTEVEYCSVVIMVVELRWLIFLFSELGIQFFQ